MSNFDTMWIVVKHKEVELLTCAVFVVPLPSNIREVFFNLDNISSFRFFFFIRIGIGHLSMHKQNFHLLIVLPTSVFGQPSNHYCHTVISWWSYYVYNFRGDEVLLGKMVYVLVILFSFLFFLSASLNVRSTGAAGSLRVYHDTQIKTTTNPVNRIIQISSLLLTINLVTN